MDISVHCDVYIFQQLVKYLQDGTELKLDTSNVVTVLITVELLGIESMTDKCINYIAKHLEEVVRNSEDLSSL